MSKRFILPSIVTLLLIGAAGSYIFLRWGGKKSEQISKSQEITKEELPAPPKADGEKPPEATAPLEQKVSRASIPQLDRPIEIRASLGEARREEAISKIKELTSILKGDSNLFSEWLDLGLWRKLIGDFEGAVEAWEYAANIRPQEPLTFHNLGDLFAYDLHDLQKAEEYYLKAVKLKPREAIYYQKLYEFYRYIKNDPGKARAILEEGISESPRDSQILEELLASF